MNKAENRVAWRENKKNVNRLNPINKAIRGTTDAPPAKEECKFTMRLRKKQFPKRPPTKIPAPPPKRNLYLSRSSILFMVTIRKDKRGPDVQ